MTLAGLAVRNLSRNRFRVVLTVLGVAVAIVAFLLLRTVVWAWASGADWAAKDRVVTRHKVTFVMTLPKPLRRGRARGPARQGRHVGQLVRRQGPQARPRVLPGRRRGRRQTYFDVYDEMKVAPDAMETWLHDRQGAIVGDVLAKKLGWKVGDRIILQSGIYPGDWQFTIDAHLRRGVQVGRPLHVRLPLGLPERLAAARPAQIRSAGS